MSFLGTFFPETLPKILKGSSLQFCSWSLNVEIYFTLSRQVEMLLKQTASDMTSYMCSKIPMIDWLIKSTFGVKIYYK